MSKVVRSLRWVRILFGACAVAALLTALGFALMPSAAEMRQLLSTEFSRATGRQIAIGEIAWHILPNPRITVRDVAIANPPWAQQANLLTARELDVRVELAALARGELNVKALALEGLRLNLERDGRSRRSWQFAVAGDDGSDTSRAAPVGAWIERLDVTDMALEFATPDSRHHLTLASLSLKGQSRNAQRLEAEGTVKGVPLRVSGNVRGLYDALTTGTGAPELALEANLDRFKLHFDGRAGSTGLAAELRASGPLPALGDLPANIVGAEITLSTGLTGQWPRLRFESLEAAINLDAQRYQVAGQLSTDFSGTPVRLAGALHTPALRLRSEAGDGDADAARPPRLALPREAPVTLDLRLSADSVTTEPRIDAVSARVEARGPLYRISDFKGKVAGAPVTGKAEIRIGAEHTETKVAVTLQSSALPSGALLNNGEFDAPLDVDIQLTATGQDPGAWAASSTGAVRVVAGKGRVRARAAETLIGGLPAIFTALFAENSEWVGMNCAVASWRLNNGTARAQALVMDTQHTTIVGEGSVQLAAEQLALLVKPFPKSATLNLAVPVRISGSFDAPAFALDEAATLRRVGGALAGIVFPPALLATFADLGYEAGGCLPAQLAQSTNAGQRILDGVSSTAATVVTETGKAVTELGKGAGSAVDEAGKAAGAAGKAAADAVESTLEEVGKGLKSLFGN